MEKWSEWSIYRIDRRGTRSEQATEISLDNALLVCENGQLRIAVLDRPEIEYRNGTGDLFCQAVL